MPILELLQTLLLHSPNPRTKPTPTVLKSYHPTITICSCNNSGPCTKRSCSDNSTLRTFLFIATVLISKCGSSTFPAPISTTTDTKTLLWNAKHSDIRLANNPHNSLEVQEQQQQQDQDFSLHFINTQTTEFEDDKQEHHHQIQTHTKTQPTVYKKTIPYFLKGLILPMLISLTLSFGYVIYKNRVKRQRMETLQNALQESTTRNPNPHYYHHHHHHHHIYINTPDRRPEETLLSNALLSVIDVRDNSEWSLISTRDTRLLHDYVCESGDTARRLPLFLDKPPEYSSVVDPPSYEQAVAAGGMMTGNQVRDSLCLGTEHHDSDNDDDVEGTEDCVQLLNLRSSAVLMGVVGGGIGMDGGDDVSGAD